jgi:hypothetical protein
MRTYLSSLILIALLTQLHAVSQPWTATHARDTSSFFPTGAFMVYASRTTPPFSALPDSMDIDTWIRKDEQHIKNLNLNYLCWHIPRYYLDKGWNMVEGFEQKHFNAMVSDLGIRMDLAQVLQWNTWSATADSSIRSRVRGGREAHFRHPCLHPDVDTAGWQEWRLSIDNKLDEIDSIVSANHTYQTFYLGEETDIYPRNCETPTDWTTEFDPEYFRTRSYALQYILHRWDEIHPDPKVKALLVIGAMIWHKQLFNDVADTLRNARLVACFTYPYRDSLANSVWEYRTTTYRGQNFALKELHDAMDMFREAYRDQPQVELWWAPQALKQIDKVLHSSQWRINESALRYPTYEELRLQVSLALSRGMKGILWYCYGSQKFPSPDSTDMWAYGMVTAATREAITADVPDGAIHPRISSGCSEPLNPYENIGRVNEEAQDIGSLMRKLDLVDVFPADEIPYNCFELDGFHAEALGPANSTDHIEAAVFKHETGGKVEWYLYVLNSLLNHTEDPCTVAPPRSIRISFKNYPYMVHAATGQPVSYQELMVCPAPYSVFVYNDTIAPGQGKLYKLDRIDCSEFKIPTPVPASLQVSVSPNPFKNYCLFQYDLPEDSRVTLRVYSLLGALVATLEDTFRMAGKHTVVFDPLTTGNRTMPSGMYFYELATSKNSIYGNLILTK